MSQSYRSEAQKDALKFAEMICEQQVSLDDAQLLLFVESDGTLSNNPAKGLWPETVELPTDLLQHLRAAGLTGQVLLSAFPEEDGHFFGIEVQVEDSNFHPLLPNPIASSYSSTGYIGTDGKLVRIPREPHPGRYYFPNMITVS